MLARGYGVFRLNFRDHGDTHHLNRELFHSCRIDEVTAAVGDVANRYDRWPLSLLGYSLGGNFALRVAARSAREAFELSRVVAICPVVDPAHSMNSLEQSPGVYRRYFMRKWRRSLQRKQALYPEDIHVDAWMQLDMRALTARLVEEYTEFATVEDYFQGYSIAGDLLRHVSVDCRIIAAADDPVIPVADFRDLPSDKNLRIKIFEHGGHCGFVDSLISPSWLERRIGYELGAGELPDTDPESVPC